MTRRLRAVSVAFALACLVVSGVLLHVTEAAGGDFHKVHGVIGEPFRLNGAEVTVQSVTVGAYLARSSGQRAVHTPGLFVRLDVDVACRTPCRNAPDRVVLHAGERTYKAWQLGTLSNPPPGYRTTNPVIFEIDPDDLGSLVADISQTEIISGYQAHGWVDLRLARRADRLRHDAASKDVQAGYGSTEVIA